MEPFMKPNRILLVNVIFALSAGFAFGDTELQIERVKSNVNAGFKERIYIDRKSKLSLTNGNSGIIKVSDGPHTIYAELYTMKTDELSFDARGGTVQITITANSLSDFAITIGGAALAAPEKSATAATAAAEAAAAAVNNVPTQQRPIGQSTLEAALYTAAERVMSQLQERLMGQLQPKTTIAVVSIASKDVESAEFVVEELAYVISNSGNFKVVDRKSLEAIRSEQDFQTSGEVDDASAVSIGKLQGANIVITGSITDSIAGVGSKRRLRLKALDVMTAEIVGSASEPF
jgi:curli biogenesis system outer membrane secretion channel CsgG